MTKKPDKDIQLSFDFDVENRKVKFLTITGRCRCGYTGEFRKAEVALEMTVPCPKCGTIMVIK